MQNAPNGCIFGNGIAGKPRGRLLLPQPPPRLIENIRMPQLRSHFLYPLAKKGAGQIGDVLIAVKTKQPQCLDFIVGQAEGIATGFVGVVLEELLHIRE